MTSSKPILVFDLDDTLYEELSYVRSGLAAVADHAAGATGRDRATLLVLLEAALAEGRSGVFDRAFERAGVHTARLVRRCVGVYRTHTPAISLWPAAERCLQRFADHRRFLVTDGVTSAQGRKVAALGLQPRFEKLFLTYRYGRRRSKPSPYCFERIRTLTGARACDIVYVADNPRKDFVGIRPLGFGTIRVLTGQHAAVQAAPGHDAALTLADLDALTADRLRAFQQELTDAHAV
jgi:putative hydrolase of the HAD superfamily